MNVDLSIIGKDLGPMTYEYDERDVLTFNVSAGAGYDELYYCREDGLKVSPGFGYAVTFEPYASKMMLVGPQDIMHTAQRTVFHAPVPVSGVITTESKVSNIFDRGEGKGCLIELEAVSYDADGNKLFTNVYESISRMGQAPGAEPVRKAEKIVYPETAPDFEISDKLPENGPLAWRIPCRMKFADHALHTDPDFARSIGFPGCIVHGSTSLSYAARNIAKALCPGEPERLKAISARMAKSVFPGATVITKIWKTGDASGVFQLVDAANGNAVLDQGTFEIA